MKKIIVKYSHRDSVAEFTLTDGKGNILDHQMMEELHLALNELKQKPGIKLITFEGGGKHFSFGASVEEHQKELAGTMLRNFHQLFFTLRDLSVPTAAKICGQCLGGGLELAMMCNFLFADQSAVFGQPEIVLGVFAPPASVILSEKIGLARAEEILITGKTFSATVAKSIGLVNEVYETREVMNQETERWIEINILPKSASSLRYAVRAVRAKFNHILGNFLPQLENVYANQLMETPDANEGINSFLEKRNPVWENDKSFSK